MAYIPTIHTFEDDINENRKDTDLPISGGTEEIVNAGEILQPSNELKSGTKIILISISVLFIIASLGAVGYYFYNQNQIKKEQEILNQEILKNKELEKQRSGIIENLKSIFPNLYQNTKIKDYVESASLDKNVITIKIAKNQNNVDNYSLFFALILANKKSFNSDIINAFKLKDSFNTIEVPVEIISTSTATTSTTSIQNKKKVTKIIEIVSTTSTTTTVSTTSIIKLKEILDIDWTDKSIENQDYKIADFGVSAVVYGYVGNNYLVIATNMKDFLDKVKDLKK